MLLLAGAVITFESVHPVQAARPDWATPPADPAAQLQLCADYPAEPAEDGSDTSWDTPERRRIVACHALLASDNPDPDIYYYAGRLWLDIYFSDKAEAMFRRGAAAGSTKAMLALGYWRWERHKDFSSMLHYLKKAAKRNDPVSLTLLGLIYRGLEPTWSTPERMDRQRGLKLLRAAAAQGYPIAQYALGMTTWPDDESDQQALEKALTYIRAAARAGVQDARETLEEEGYAVPELTDGMRYPNFWEWPMIFNRP